ncbi:secreted protein [Streptantibioticus cattleyicolor NRRL 8057 = DSM 46488]|uniref:Secreted protein n=1 Tax=Streptantibioticus cattleyicolor (strain ATCC 35852 / DSM 46488 / JCM 4925 / NBRC 14057 / NRRL 8057) TaxID=1003195 RepID=G8WMN5_STREN|nr:secreted protein [Streptantibioticus cattleyicolor NRRL 8057 = DSM 46488]
MPAEPSRRSALRTTVLPCLRACALVATVLLAYAVVADLIHPRVRHAAGPRAVAGTAARGARPPAVPRPAASAPGPRPRPANPRDTAAEKRSAGVAKEVRDTRVDLSAVADAVPAHGARWAVAVHDLTTGNSGGLGDGYFDTASIVKIDILATLLLRAQQAHRGLTDAERDYAAVMVRQSDNAAATALWRRIGGADGLDAGNGELGVTGVRGDQDDLWGLTQTTATGQLDLLRAVFGDTSPLNEDSRGYLRELMAHIDPSQRWGVSAAADDRTASALKNGWLQRSTTGLWDINSIGRVRHAGHTLLVAVVSSGNATQGAGVALVEAAAREAVEAVVAAGHPEPVPTP